MKCLKDCSPPNYNVYNRPRKGCKGGGGIAVIVRNFDQSPSVRFDLVHNDDYATMEAMVFKLVFTKDLFLQFIVVYRPPGFANFKNFVAEFKEICIDALLRNANLICLGDFNVHYNDRANLYTGMFDSMLNEVGLVQHVTSPTHTSGNTLDLVITYENNDIDVIGYLYYSAIVKSDHLAVCIQSKLDFCKGPMNQFKRKITFRKWNQIQNSGFQQKIDGLFLNDTYANVYDVDYLSTYYNTMLTNVLNVCLPLHCKYVSWANDRPWIDSELLVLKRGRRKLERLWQNSGDDIHYIDYKFAVDNYFAVEIQKKKIYFQGKLLSGDAKNLFNICKNLFYGKRVVKFPTCPTDSILATKFNHAFMKKIDDIKTQWSTESFLYSSSLIAQCPSVFKFRLIDVTDLRVVVRELGSKCCTLDPIPTWLVKSILPSLEGFLVQMINASLTTGVFPNNLKLASVSALLKKSNLDSENFGNYRPVSNLPFASKLLEKVVYNQLIDYLSFWKLLDKFQSGFRPHYGVETALLRMMNDILRLRDAGSTIIVILLDISAAFDTLEHSTLISLLEVSFGIQGIELEWFTNYLNNRRQYVKINNCNSSELNIKCGVPQGSLLGPVLFNLYMVPLFKIFTEMGITYHSYADDTQFYFVSENVVESVCLVETLLGRLSDWFQTCKLKLNAAKTQIMVVNNNKKDIYKFEVVESDISPASKVSNLGILIDDQLSLKIQIDDVCRKALYHLRLISKNSKFLTPESLKKSITAFVLSRLNYCCTLYFGLPDYLIQKLQYVQNSAARLISGTRMSDHISPVINGLGWLTMVNFVRYRILVVMYSCLCSEMPNYLTEILYVHSSIQTTRLSSKICLSVPLVRSKYGERAFSVCGPKLWNALPDTIKLTPTFALFKAKLRRHLLSIQDL